MFTVEIVKCRHMDATISHSHESLTFDENFNICFVFIHSADALFQKQNYKRRNYYEFSFV